MVRFAAAALAFVASFMAVSASANVAGNAATRNLNRRQEAEPAQPNQGADSAQPDSEDLDDTLDSLVDELISTLGDIVNIAKDVKKNPNQA